MKWFFGIADGSPLWDKFSDMIKVAVWTAKQRTTLEPHCLYDGAENDLTAWLRSQGVKIIPLRSRFYDLLKEEAILQKNALIFTAGRGVFLRIEISSLEGIFAEGEYALYTDCDVIFQKDPVPVLREMRCELFSAAPEFRIGDYSYLNSGVMLMNIGNLKKTLPEFTKFTESKFHELFGTSWDQVAYNGFYKDRWDRLGPQMNWKPYWGVNPEAIIVHFHGPKPTERSRYLNGEKDGFFYLAAEGFYEYASEWEALLGQAKTSRS